MFLSFVVLIFWELLPHLQLCSLICPSAYCRGPQHIEDGQYSNIYKIVTYIQMKCKLKTLISIWNFLLLQKNIYEGSFCRCTKVKCTTCTTRISFYIHTFKWDIVTRNQEIQIPSLPRPVLLKAFDKSLLLTRIHPPETLNYYKEDLRYCQAQLKVFFYNLWCKSILISQNWKRGT